MASSGSYALSPTFSGLGLSGSTLSRIGGHFPDPFMDYASMVMPRNVQDVLRWAEYIYLTNGTYRMAAQRVVRYFLTRLEIFGVSDEEKSRYEKFLSKDLGIMEFLAEVGDDFMAYGNCFISMYMPFKRLLKCPKCGKETPISEAVYQFKSYKFFGVCDAITRRGEKKRKCSFKGNFEHIDRRLGEAENVKLIRWSPHEIKLMRHPVSGDIDYWWDIPQRYKEPVTRGTKFFIETLPWEMIEAIRDRQLFKFEKDALFHMKEETLGGVHNYGWGISRILPNFKQAYYIQILKRYNEALALDYIIPFRVITPQAGNHQGDPVLHSNLGNFSGNIQSMLRQHRRDPATWHCLPFPINYEALGGEGVKLTDHELMNQAQDELLNAIGIPAEMYRGSLTVQAAPTALRLFQQTWMHLIGSNNRLINWLIKSLATNFQWEQAEAQLQPPTMADDLDRRNIMLQLMASKMVSKELALRPLGADPVQETERILNETRIEQTLASEFQEEQMQRQDMEALIKSPAQAAALPPALLAQVAGMQGGAAAPPGAASGGAAPPAGAPMPAPAMGGGAMGGGGNTPDAKLAEADILATQLVSMPELERKAQLAALRNSDTTLHALVKARMEKIRGQAASQGKAMLLQPQPGGQPMM